MTSTCVDIFGGSDTLRKHPPLCPSLCGGNSYHLLAIKSRCSDTFGNADALRQLSPMTLCLPKSRTGSSTPLGTQILSANLSQWSFCLSGLRPGMLTPLDLNFFCVVGIKTRYVDTFGPQFLLCCWDQGQVC